MDNIAEIQKQCFEDSEAWFPNQSRDLVFMTVAMTGELGEFANIVKKLERGSIEYTQETVDLLREELCDVFIYLCNTAVLLDCHLGKMYDVKREKNVGRFGNDSNLGIVK